MSKSLSRGRVRLFLAVASGLLASPLTLASAADPFAPFPAADGEASDPRIEAMRAALRPDVFKPAHEVVITDDMFFKWKDVRTHVKRCGGKPSLTTHLPKELPPATPFLARFENPLAPIRTYAGTGYACTFPARLGPLSIGYDAPVLQGLITYSDGSYWLGEVSGAANANARESVMYAEATPLTPTPAGLGEWGRPDGSRVQGVARPVALAEWPNRGWDSGSVVSFTMSSVQRSTGPEGARLAGSPGTAAAAPAPGASASASPASAAPLAATVAATPSAPPAPNLAPTPAAPPAASPAPAPSPVVAPAATPAPVAAAASRPAAAHTDPRVDAFASRIEGWRAALAPEAFTSARSSVASGALSKSREYNAYVQACGGGAPTPFRLGFANADARIRSFTGFASGCVFPAQPDDQVFGIIEYADGSRWLGQVSAMPQAEAIELGAFGGLPPPVQNLAPAPHGIGEWTWPDGTRVQGLAAPLQPKFLFRDIWVQGPLGAFAMTEVAQLVTTEGVAYAGGIVLSTQGFSSDQATVRWRDGRVFIGSVANSMPRSGTLSYPDGGRITGTVAVGEDGIMHWEDGAELDLSIATAAGPPGRYVYFAPIRFEAMSQAVLEVANARPIDAATLARAGRNTRQCPQPPAIPSGWVAWWPSCEGGPSGRVAMYSPDAQQMLLYSAGGDPKRYLLRKGSEPGRLRGIEIRADEFTRDAVPTPTGSGELYLWGELVFNGRFLGQEPTTGYCVVPADEGGGWEACEYSRGARIDLAHQLRLERRELARQQDELRRQIQQEQYAQEEWEAEQEQAELEAQKRQDEIEGRLAIANAIRGAAYDIGMAYADREAARDAADYRQRQAEREASRPAYSSPSSSGGYSASGQEANERAAQLAARQAELERRQMALRVQSQPAPAQAPQLAGAAATGPGIRTQVFEADPDKAARDRRCFELFNLIASADSRANECTGTKESGGFETLGAWREHERKCWAAARETQEPLKAEQDRLCGRNAPGKARGM